MEAAEETLTYLHDTGLHRKLLPGDKGDKKKTELEDIKGHESNYVDLDMKPECAKTVKVTFTGEGNQLSVIKCDGSKQDSGDEQGEPPPETRLPDSDQGSEIQDELQDQLDPSDCSEHVDELQYTDMYLNSKTESDDGASGVLSDHSGSDTVEDESHYITTHEIQLTELDHDVDYDPGRGTCWEFEDDNLVYSFVDYASFESDETQEGTLVLEGRSQGNPGANLGGAAVSTEQEESDLCASSDESLCNKLQSGDANTGKIHLSIKATSRAVHEQVSVPESHFSFVGPGARAGPLSDRAPYFIPAPGRQHLATELRRNEYSSGASSSISELDDADKEVRNLTAKSFRSLACPYFDAINLSTSSESSMSEYGLNKWSAYVDWNYGNIARGGERSVIAHKTSSATLKMNNTVESKRHDKSTADTKSPQSKMYALNKRTTFQQASSNKIQVKDPVQPEQRGVTLNFHCDVEAPEGTRRPQCSKNPRSTEDSGAASARSGCAMQCHLTESPGDTHKRAIFASSLLKNVISKKMQFEKEREMERGDRLIRDRQRSLGRGLQRQSSESGSGLSVDDQHMEGSRPSSCGSADELRTNKAPEESEKGQHECPKSSLNHSQRSAFNSLKADEPEPVKEAEPTAKEGLDTSSMLTKLLFVPSYQLHSKEKSFAEDMGHTPASGTAAGLQNFEKDEIGKGGKPPEIKIRLRTVKENKGCTLNIASLLTPKISYNSVNTLRAAGEAKCHILSATDKMPTFTVRDIRDTKCKFQMPIYRVRDVRKLVKSSYRFVSLDNSESKCSTAADKLEEKGKTEPVKQLSPSPIVIKCHSVKTNVKSQATEGSQTQTETCDIAQSENAPSHCVTSRVQPSVSKQLHADPSDIQPNAEAKLTKQRHVPGEPAEWRNEPTIPKQAAIEKLRAAVKTMEQLYVFDRNEWKRKSQAPQPITESHVRSLIAREEQGGEQQEAQNTDRIPQATETGSGAADVIQVPFNDNTFTTQSQQSQTFSNKSVLHFGNGNQARVSISSVRNSIPQSSAPQTSSTMKSSRAPAAPLSVKIEPPKHVQVQQGKVKIIPTNPTVTQGCPDSENYLTIPGMGYTSEIKLPKEGSQARTGDSNIPEQKRSPVIMEYPATSIYHHPAAATATGPQPPQQVLCFSPTASSIREAGPQTQRKMLLDPTTGHYYMVDTPIQATTKRLFDPETGHYVDVPMTHSPASPVTPVPLCLSPLTLTPGAFAPSYMIYPSFIPSPTLQAQAAPPQSPCQSEDAGGYKMKNARSPRLETNTTGAESVYYTATGGAPPQGPLQLPVSLGHATGRGGGASADRKPVISITTQQGPRIIAPPSFDGTTMSFVVEHR